MKAQINILAYCLISILGLGSLIFSQTIKTLTVPQGTKILAELETTLNSRTSRQHDRFSATVTESIFVEGIEVIPIGTSLMGKVVRVKKAGRIKRRAEMNLEYESLLFPNGVTKSIVAVQSDLDGKEQVGNKEGTIRGESSRKRDAIGIGGRSASGAALGGITRGRKGAAIGALTGGLVGLLGSMTRKGEPIEIPAGTRMVIRLEQPLEILSSFHKVNQ